MTVTAAAAETTYALVAANLGPFNSGWLAEDLSQIAVWLDTGSGAAQIGGGLVTITGAAPLTAGINVTLSAGNLIAGAWPAGSRVTLQRVTPKTQPSALGTAVGFDPAAYEAALDHLDRQVQDLATGHTRSLRGAPGDYPLKLPPASQRAGLYLAFDGNGNPVASIGVAAGAGFTTIRTVIATGAVASTDQYLAIKIPSAAGTLTLPDPATCAGRQLIIKDALGHSGAYPITVQPAAGLIDGQAFYVMNTPWQAITVISDGAAWSII